MTDDPTTNNDTPPPPAKDPGDSLPPAAPPTGKSTPGIDQRAPKSANPADDLYARARASGLSRDILAWQDARGK
jgi:hypothetical protein